ncbi:bifunctional 4-hydroxy-2-oxoglutarate aldolase/2-dehydro-3-deoxy-phosphogluconate aldolase [Nesterenkonia halophila]|uniref:bifunctional 4-hydroxy-2-oxoglutarate aldolase/2-dehydro-3-deoxy-phosphogluconate aldolase n=1 Tax=Nesterenkonia halophila TaxID=302044 RepID=UPI0012917DF9|nr:bifunctional 4-hydroxy-2-oxoglutarate aldolase/2-dehydro-3-deoxy-phosphogluconate aldolase [Nesterenkonia halophila]
MSDSGRDIHDIHDIMGLAPVIPVVTVEDPETAVPLARALVDGGVPTIEVTLRTPAALEALRRIAAEVPEIAIGAGTVLDPRQADRAVDAGAGFVVTPGLTPSLLRWIGEAEVPCLPGVSTVSQLMEALEQGITGLKFFPAEAAGGAPYLRAVGGPVPEVTFCPTGGITPSNASGYLALGNVACVGGSWLTPREVLAAGDFAEVTRRARETRQLAPTA